jgi:hypothetical protein
VSAYYLRTHEAHTVNEAAGKRALSEGEHSPFHERPVGGRGGGGGGGGGAGGGREEEDVLREEERVGRAEDGELSSTREAALRRAQVAEELRERLRRFNCEADALDAQL